LTGNVSNRKGNYPKLKEGAPDSVKILVRPSQLLLVSKPGYNVMFGGTVATTFDKKVIDVKSGGGYASLFGIPISLGANVSSKNRKRPIRAPGIVIMVSSPLSPLLTLVLLPSLLSLARKCKRSKY